MSKPHFPIRDIAFLALWPLIAILLVFIAERLWGVLSSSLRYTNELDLSAIATMAYIIFANLLIFLAPLFVILKYLQKSQSITLVKLVALIIFGGLTVYVLSEIRNFAAGISHIDCSYACGYKTLPLPFDNLASVITITILITLYATMIVICAYSYFAKNRK